MTYLLDTSICVPLINGNDPALRGRLLRNRPDEIVLCAVVRAELELGARSSKRAAENLDRVRRFCEPLASLPFDDEAAVQHGSLRALLRREGRTMGANRMLIASIALAAKVTLVTRNVNEFARVPQLSVEAW